jgi:hypothetical protein
MAASLAFSPARCSVELGSLYKPQALELDEHEYAPSLGLMLIDVEREVETTLIRSHFRGLRDLDLVLGVDGAAKRKRQVQCGDTNIVLFRAQFSHCVVIARESAILECLSVFRS